MKNKHPKKQPVLPLHIRNKFRGTRHAFRAVSEARLDLDPKAMPALARAMQDLSLRGLKSFPSLLPPSLSELRPDNRTLAPVKAEKETMWTASVICLHAARINAHLDFKNRLDLLFLEGRYHEAIDVLDEIGKESSFSLWLIELRQAALQADTGLGAQKEYLKHILNTRPPVDRVALTAFHASIRNEPTTQIFSFQEHFSDLIRSGVQEPAFRAWLLFRICDELDDPVNVLRSEQASSIIDWYETFMHLATNAVAYDTPLAQTFASAVCLFDGQLNDPRIDRILSLTIPDSGRLERLPIEDPRYVDECLIGPEEIEPLVQLTLQQAAYLESEGFHCRTKEPRFDPQKVPGIYKLVVNELRTLASNVFDIQSFYTLMRVAANYRFTSLPSQFRLAAWRQVTSGVGIEESALRFEFINSPQVSVRHVALFTGNFRDLLASRFLEQYPASPSIQLELLALGLRGPYDSSKRRKYFSSVPADRVKTAELKRLVAQAHWPAAEVLATELLASANPPLRRNASRVLANALLQQDKIFEAVEFIVSSALKDEALSYLLPISKVVARITRSYRKENAGRLSTPIIYNLLRNRNSKTESVRAYTYEDFLTAHSFTHPTELKHSIESFNRSEIIYYLRWICVPDTMQMSTSFAGTKEVEDERVNVCSFLSDLDPNNAKEYEAESKAITQHQVIREGVTQVEENKIYVDVPGLKKWAELNLRESYTRYQSLRSSGLDSDTSGLVDAIRDALKHLLPTGLVLRLPQNEATDLLVTMLYKLKDAYLNNPTHGLDSYLSMRIRHGSLAGQLRNPLEVNHVITQRDGDSDQYKTNDYWLNRLSALSYDQLMEVDNALREFSRSYDLLLDSYLNDFIQIGSSDKPQGLLTLPLTEATVALLADELFADTTFDAFLDHTFRYFRELLDVSLQNVRSHIDSHLRPQTDSIVETLEKRLTLLGVNQVHELDTAVHVAHTELQQTIEHVKQWFYRSEPEKGAEFSFEQLVRIGLRCVTRIHDDFKPNLHVKSPEAGLTSEELRFFSDVFFIIFDNVRVHSGLSHPVVRVEGILDGNDLRVIVRSDVSQPRATRASRDKVASIMESIRAGQYYRAVRSEGGTGLIKLRNILRLEPATGETLDFGFDEIGLHFIVQFAVPMFFGGTPYGGAS